MLFATHLVDRVTEVLGNMKLIESDFILCLRHARQRGVDERGPHVHRNAVDRRDSPRATARCMMPSTAFQLSPIKRETAEIDASCNQSITSASNKAVKPLPGSAHGTDVVTNP